MLKRMVVLSVALMALSVSVGAFAQSPNDTPTAWTQRELITPKLNLNVLAGPTSEVGLSVSPYESFGLQIRAQGGDAYVAMPLGVSFGVIDNLDVGLGLPISFKPGAFGDMPLWATYRFFQNDNVEIGARVTLFLPTNGLFVFQAGLPVRFHNDALRLDTGFYFRIFATNPAYVEFFIPGQLGFQIQDQLYAGLQTELHLITGRGGSVFGMPIYGFVAYTLTPSFGPVDLGFRFGFDDFLRAGTDQSGNPFYFKNFSFTLGANLSVQF